MLISKIQLMKFHSIKLTIYFYRVPQYLKEIEQKEIKNLKNQIKRDKKKLSQLYKPRRLGPHLYQEDSIPVIFSDELPEHLRNVKNKVNLHKDFYKNLEKRNIIEVRKRM